MNFRVEEVDLSRLKGFHLRFAPKNEEWRDFFFFVICFIFFLERITLLTKHKHKSGVTCNWWLRLHLEVLELNGGRNRFHSDRTK